MKLNDELRYEITGIILHTWMAVRVIFWALAIWVPWTVLRITVCWSVPLILHGELPEIATAAPYFSLLFVPFLPELFIPAAYLWFAWCDNKLDNVDEDEARAIIVHDTAVLRYRLMRPGIVTFVAHFVCMWFSPELGFAASWIPWALSFLWWQLPDYDCGPGEQSPGVFATTRPAPDTDAESMLTAEEAQARLDARHKWWEPWFGGKR